MKLNTARLHQARGNEIELVVHILNTLYWSNEVLRSDAEQNNKWSKIKEK